MNREQTRDYVQQIVDTVSAWDGLSANPHRFGGVEFDLGKVEIGHIHSNGMVDIPFTIRVRERLVAEKEAGLHHLLQDSGWITFYVRNADDVKQAIRLYRLSYVQKRYRRPSDRAHADYAHEIEALKDSFSDTIVNALYPSAHEIDPADDESGEPNESEQR